MTVEEKKDSPASDIGWGLVSLASGIGLFLWFAHLEEEGGSTRINWIIALIYKVLGKWGVLLIFGGLGVFLLSSGIRGMIAAKGAPREPRAGRRR